MTTLEDRLRADLPELADALLESEPIEPGRPMELTGIPFADGRPRLLTRRRVLVSAAAVAAAGVAAGAGWPWRLGNGGRIEVSGSPAPAGFGTWTSIAPAPIEPRPYAMTAWTGTRVLFWAGSSLSRGFAYTDGAFYDPEADVWEPMAVPGWGHPGLTSAFFDGELYALAKGGGTRFDPIAGTWRDLPPVEGMYLAATVASDGGIWGLGPADLNRTGQPDLAIARYHPDEDRWTYGSVWEGTAERASVVASLAVLESTSVWTGSEIVVCDASGGCVAFDPAGEKWREVPALSGAASPSIAVGTDLGLAMVVPAGDRRGAAVHLLTDTGWEERASGIPMAEPATATTVAAGTWLVVFGSGQPPVVVHLPTGVWHETVDGPLGGVQGPNTAWTGEQLVVWGGVPDDPSATPGAVWTPPA